MSNDPNKPTPLDYHKPEKRSALKVIGLILLILLGIALLLFATCVVLINH